MAQEEGNTKKKRGHWVLLGTHAGNAVVRAEPFAEIDVELQLLWAEPAE